MEKPRPPQHKAMWTHFDYRLGELWLWTWETRSTRINVLGSKLPLFPYDKGWSSTNSRGLYTHYKDSYYIKVGGFPSPQKTRQPNDHGSKEGP